MFTVLRIILSFALVGGLLWFFARSTDGKLGSLLQRTVSGSEQDAIAVVARRQLTRSSSLVMVRAGSRHLLLSVSDGDGVSMLVEGDDLLDTPPPDSPPFESPFDSSRFESQSDGGGGPTGTSLVPVNNDIELRDHDPTDHTDPDHTNPDPANPDDPDTGAQRRRWNPARTSAWTPSTSPHGHLPPRMSFIDALREQTVRRS